MKRVVRLLIALTTLSALSLGQAPTASAADAPTGTPTKVEQVSVTSVPPVPGVTVSIDGLTATTGPDGSATLTRQRYLRTPATEIQVTDAGGIIELGPDTRARFIRAYYPSSQHPVLSFDIEKQVDFTFHDGDSEQAANDFDSLTVRSSVGEVKVIQPGETPWFQAQRVVPLNGGLEVKDLYWTVQSLDRHGSNVVNRSQQRFVPAAERHVAVDLLYYTAKFRARDAFLFNPRGSAIDLTFPDGHIERIELDGYGVATVSGLPRGQYTVAVVGGGPGMSQPVAITRNQEVDLKVLSWLDLAIVGFVLIGGLVGLVLLGRTLRKRRAAAAGPREVLLGHRALPPGDFPLGDFPVVDRSADPRVDAPV
jgi:hypothetical protein